MISRCGFPDSFAAISWRNASPSDSALLRDSRAPLASLAGAHISRKTNSTKKKIRPIPISFNTNTAVSSCPLKPSSHWRMNPTTATTELLTSEKSPIPSHALLAVLHSYFHHSPSVILSFDMIKSLPRIARGSNTQSRLCSSRPDTKGEIASLSCAWDEAYGADHGRLLLDLPFNDFTRKLVINITSTTSKESSGW